MIRAIFQSTGFESGEFGKKGSYIFSDISEDNEPLADKYVFSQLKCIKRLKPKKGDVFQFDAELDYENGLKIKRPKNLVKVDLSHLKDGYEYCITKFLKESRVLTKEDSRNEKVAYIRMTTLFGEKLFRYITLSFKLNSLHWFTTEDGLKFCKEQKIEMDKSNKDIIIHKEEVKLEKNKIGDDIHTNNKKKDLIGFLK
tara:strand:+ start:17250 stop:17843 length:594 start_codon:yes stop_codon:yes gene_type:complete